MGVRWALGIVVVLGVVGVVAFGQPRLMPGGGERDRVYGQGVGVHAERVDVIAFGSCHKLENSHAVWDAVNGLKGGAGPDVFVFLGDNVYAHGEGMAVLRDKYAELRGLAGVERLFAASDVIGVWDDHDYGPNDSGRENPDREGAQRALLDFLEEPSRSWRRDTAGVYDAEVYGPEGERVQFILLDTRYFRDALSRSDEREAWTNGIGGGYVADWDRGKTMLGEDQWAWLEERLREPAELRVICSSIQVVAEDHRYEKWANLPLERARLFDVIRRTGAEGVVFLSGDRHRAEISRFDVRRAEVGSGDGVGYDLYDVTSSALNTATGRWVNELNRHRVGSQYVENNFGVLEINWEERDGLPAGVEMRIHGEDGREVLRQHVAFVELRR